VKAENKMQQTVKDFCIVTGSAKNSILL
jgi:hypothetical protein